jgi:hypothetical protein
MTEQDEGYEGSRPSKATMESATATPSEQSEQEHVSAGGQASEADLERPAGSSREAGLSKDDGDGQDREGETAALESPSGVTAQAEGESSPGEEQAPLFTGQEAERFRERWATVQAGFVDQPRQMVEQADDLVSDLMQQLTAGFSQRRSKLEEQWNEGDQVSTEDLRVALTRYRSFFNRLLSA